MGAHSLGKAARANSGFTACTGTSPAAGGTCASGDQATTGKWVQTNTQLSNSYFDEMLKPWAQVGGTGAPKALVC